MRLAAVLASLLLFACGKIDDNAEPQGVADAATATAPPPPPDAAGVRIPGGWPPIDPSYKVVPCETGDWGGTGGYAEPEGTEAIYGVITNTRCPNHPSGVRGRPASDDCHVFGSGGSPYTHYSCGAPVICPRVADSSCGRAYECAPANAPSTAFLVGCPTSGTRICCP